MMRTYQKGYLAPWSSRRETAGLMGTFLIFLLGFPGHSEIILTEARHLIQQLIQLMLVFLGLAVPVVQKAVPAVVSITHTSVQHSTLQRGASVDSSSMVLRFEPVLYRFMYVFEGKATLRDAACPNASVLIRLTSGERTVTKGTVTEKDGSYSLQVPIDAEDKAPVDWAIEAYTPDFEKVEISGRQIVQREDQEKEEPIIVTNPVEFVVSLSK